MADTRRSTPRTDSVLAEPLLRAASTRLGPAIVKRAVAAGLERCRAGEIEPSDVVPVVLDTLPAAATSLHRVVNATGVVVHTNLGRAPLSAAAVDALLTAAGATDVELDLTTARRGRRGRGTLEALASAVPDAEAVHVVNNGAAALALVTRVLCRDGGSVVIARGELVEIGDGFRIPELLESVGVRLREVGTTNRVRLADYEAAVGDRTAFVLKVHPSNFVVRGFTSAVPVVHDIGSGLLAPHPRLPDEPSASGSLRDGAALVTASGDKLLGGPQCGLLVGRAELVERLRRHPLARALRVDKLTLAALEATLTGPEPPVARALATRPEELRVRATALAEALTSAGVACEVVASEAAVGGGGAPELPLPSVALALPESLAVPLRTGFVAVLGRVERGRLLLDLLAVAPEDDQALAEAVRRAAAGTGSAR